MKRSISLWALVVLAGGIGGIAVAADAPASKLNTQSGDIEIADSVWSGSGFDIRHVVNAPLTSSGAQAEVIVLSNHPADDRGPAMALTPDGGSHVVWWRDGDTGQIFHRQREGAEGAWSQERLLSAPGEDARNPALVQYGDTTWMAYEVRDPAGVVTVHAQPINDEPDPFGSRASCGYTSFPESVRVRLHAEQGQLWVTWIDSDEELGWARFEDGAWLPVRYETYADGIREAQERIRAAVMDPGN